MSSSASILKAPFDHYTAANLLLHFRQRRVKFYPVCEAEQCQPGFIEEVLQNRFKFNNETHYFIHGMNWLENPSDDIEWLIMLHKGYYLVGLVKLFSETGNEKYLNKWFELTNSWIAQVDNPGFIATDVTGRRIQNWIYAFYYYLNSQSEKISNEDFLLRFLNSLECQVDYLINNLATARNHRTLELHAVFLAALVFPEFKKSKQWLSFSVQALADNAASDILADGVHCELSTFYHHIVLKNLLAVKRLAVANNIIMPARFDAAVVRALQFSMFIHKPDGQIPSLSDGDSGCFYSLLKLGYELYGDEHVHYVFSQGSRGQAPVEHAKAFSNSGYYIFRSDWGKADEEFRNARYLVFDCGPLGAGNHGHLDLLNIEMAAYGRSLIVDPGRYTYDESGPVNWRVLFRSTRYHNTVEVDGKNQINYQYSEVKGKFHIKGPHAQTDLSCLLSNNTCHFIHGKARSHEYKAEHQRKIFFVNGEYWLISDVMQDRLQHQYALRYHLSPEAQEQITVEQSNDLIIVDSPNLVLLHPLALQSEVSIEPGFVSTSYGKKTQAPIIKFQRRAKNTVFESLLIPYQQQRPEITLQILDVEICPEQQASGTASAFSVTIQTTTQQFQDLFFIAHDGIHRRWHYQNFHCVGQFCYMRLNSDGNVENFFTGPDSTIEIGAQLLRTQTRKS